MNEQIIPDKFPKVLTIIFQKGRNGTMIGKIMEVPDIVVRGANQTEVRFKLVEAFGHYQKELLILAK